LAIALSRTAGAAEAIQTVGGEDKMERMYLSLSTRRTW
jgi:hypothetical protein